ncbi:MAG: hypothetical protein GY801_02125 [bacterium]|nr:hypothetical protein [bacterium]
MSSSKKTLLKQPYPGLRSFTREESHLFFGREEQLDRLLEKLGTNRFISVLGLSGCGKSSLVRAGLIPALECGYLASAGAQWRIATMRPGRHPRQRLAEALLKELVLGFELLPLLGKETIAEAEPLVQANLRCGPRGLVELFSQTPVPKGNNLLVIVDQFEELFRYHQHEDENEAEAFVALLLESAKQNDVPIYIVITMRSEFVGYCSLFSGLAEQVNAGQFLIPRLSREQQQQAIEEPAKVSGGEVAPRLVNTLLNEMGNNPDRLPLMQHCLMRMWQMRQTRSADHEAMDAALTLTLENYEAVGGLQNALSNHADEAFNELDSSHQQIAKFLFRSLVDLERRDVRHPSPLQDIADIADASETDVKLVVDAFRRTDRCFLTPAAERKLESDSILDVSHESLLRQWKRLKGWLQEEKRQVDFYAYLEQAARRWKQGEGRLGDALDVASFRREKIKKKWAGRYGKHFELCREFVDASQEALEEEERQKEQEQQRELEIQHKLAEAAEARQQAEEKARREAEQRAAEQKRSATRLRWFTLGLVLAFLLMAGIARWAWKAQNEAVLQRNLAQTAQEKAFQQLERTKQAQKDAEFSLSRQLAVQANMALEQSPQRSLLLGIEAMNIILGYGDAGGKFTTESLQNALKKVGVYGLELDGPPWEVAFSSDNHWLAAGSASGTVCLWDLQENDPIQAALCRQRGHEGAIYRTAISGDTRWLITGGSDKEVHLWNLSKFAEKQFEKPEHTLEEHDDAIWGMRLSSDGRWLVTGDRDVTVLWDLAKENPVEHPMTLQGNISRWSNEHDLSPDDRWLVTREKDGTIRLWDLESENPLIASRQLAGHSQEVNVVAFSPDSRWLASGSRGETDAYLWDLSGGQNIVPRPLPGHEEGVVRVAVNDSGWLVTVSQKGIARLWNIAENEPRTFLPHEKDVSAIRMSSDNHWLITGDDAGAVLLWDLTTADPLTTVQQLSGHNNPVYRLEMSADSRWLMTRSWDGIVLRWDLQHDDPSTTSVAFPGRKEFGWRVALSPNNRWFAMSSQNHFARLWDLEAEIPSDIPDEPGQLIELACRSVKRNLSHKEWEQYFPGEDYRETCPGLPIPESIVD